MTRRRDFYIGGSGPINWNAVLADAQKRAIGDPLTGAFYTWTEGQYTLFQEGQTPVECGNQLAIAFDAATRQVLKHGRPEEVERYAINARKAYSQREDDIRHLVPTLAVVWMPPGFDADEINEVLANPIYLIKLMEQAQRVEHLPEGPALLPSPTDEEGDGT